MYFNLKFKFYLEYELAVNSANEFVNPSDPSVFKRIPVFLIEPYMVITKKSSLKRYYSMLLENFIGIGYPAFTVKHFI